MAKIILDLKCSSKTFDLLHMQKRYKQTLKFIKSVRQPVLDIGPGNDFGKALAEHFRYDYFHTVGDLDNNLWLPLCSRTNRTVFCFEVLEHLMNPFKFLEELKRYLYPDALIYISVPRHWHPIFWSDCHFHEYDKKRTLHLFQSAGYEILDKKMRFHFPQFKQLLLGIRPIFRWLYRSTLGLERRYFYCLRCK